MPSIVVKIKPFEVPDVVYLEQPPKPRQKGMLDLATSFNLSELSEQTLGELCDEFRTSVFRKAGKNELMKGKRNGAN